MGRWQMHRGPDAWGEWVGDGVALGHNRLAILDLEGGAQPMASPDGAIQVVFNGEIYNFASLRAELARAGHRFRSDHSDTEVIVHGYAEWGTGVFTRLEGMFGIGLWDARARRLVLARDRAGIKPLYYALADEGIAFASEVKSLVASGVVPPEMRTESMLDYFTFRAPVRSRTMFEGVQRLPSGHWCEWRMEQGFREPVPYWTFASHATPPSSLAEAEQRVEEALDAAVRSHLVSDVPLGVFLSGGVDSSLIAALARRYREVDAFTVGTDSPLDETSFATRVADHLGMRLHVRKVTPDDFLNRFGDWMYHNDDPVSDPSALALMLLTEHARQAGMKVMLAGEGADELFGGYNSYLRFAALLRLCATQAGRGVGRLAARRLGGRTADYLEQAGELRFVGTAHVATSAVRRRLFRGDLAERVEEWTERTLAPPSPRGGDALRDAMIFDQAVRLPDDVLSRTDRATMAFSLEARVPFLDRAVVELANALPSRWCVRPWSLTGKRLLKRIAARHVPREVIYRPKRGFDLPLAEWLAGPLREQVESLIEGRRFAVLDYGYLADTFRKHRAGDHSATALIWAWFVLERWYELWMEDRAIARTPAVDFDRASYAVLAPSVDRQSA